MNLGLAAASIEQLGPIVVLVGWSTSEARLRAMQREFVDSLEPRAACDNHRLAVLRTTREPSIRSGPPAAAEPPRIFLLCPESLGPKARCVEDSLRARGFRVHLAIGRRARRWVRQVPPGSPSVRVLCVAQIDPTLANKLRQGRDDFHIVDLETPSQVVAEIERLTGRARTRRRPTPSRMYLAQPTLIEQQLTAQRSWGWAAVAAVLLLAVGTLGGTLLGRGAEDAVSPTAAKPAMAASVRPDATAPTHVEHDGPVLSAVAPIDPDELDATLAREAE